MKLVIVESPTKAKTIEKFLPRGFRVKSSYGHVRDLPKKEMGIEIENNFTPRYIVPDSAKARLAKLKELSDKAEEIILATDEDREGEAISWHLLETLKIKNKKKKRIVFHEITQKAILKALENPRSIDENLVNAQQARRILDRLVGYELSPFLWKKIRFGLSAGRVQSVALRFVVEKEKEIKNFKPQEYWNLSVLLFPHQKESSFFEAKIIKENGKSLGKMGISNKKQAEKIVEFLKKAHFRVSAISQKETLKTPPPPYTTSTLQQDANTRLGFSSKKTMSVAQKLYEGISLDNKETVGLITYMRTDSLNLSLEFLLSVQKIIEKKFGSHYCLKNPRFYKNKSKNAQEAHEAIRPTFPEKDPESLKKYLDSNQYRLYKIIWERTLACQMAPAIIENVAIEITATKEKSSWQYLLKALGSTVKFNGYMEIYSGRKIIENLLPQVSKEEELDLKKINSEQKFTLPPSRYSEATLIKILEENGIGRPSTYAPTISTIVERKYVEKDENKKFYPTEIGILVSDLLVKHFSKIVDYNFTAEMENNLDEIAEGKKEWVPIIGNFYRSFHKNLLEKSKEIKKEEFQEKIDKSCPECGGDLVSKFGRFGKFIACSNYPNCRYTEKTAIEKKQEEEIEKQNPQEKCELCQAPMVIKKGRFGFFLGCSNYPQCKNIKKVETKTGIQCPKCKTGEIIEKKTKTGRLFYGCNKYPACDFALWNKPSGEICPRCKSLLVFVAKGKLKCSNKNCSYEK